MMTSYVDRAIDQLHDLAADRAGMEPAQITGPNNGLYLRKMLMHSVRLPFGNGIFSDMDFNDA